MTGMPGALKLGDHVVLTRRTSDLRALFAGSYEYAIIERFSGRVGVVTGIEWGPSGDRLDVAYGMEHLSRPRTDFRLATVEEMGGSTRNP